MIDLLPHDCAVCSSLFSMANFIWIDFIDEIIVRIRVINSKFFKCVTIASIALHLHLNRTDVVFIDTK